ncbi:uncharacterized protein with PIN domain [Actinopolyspora lacussalsi]|nr:uncharacterized protein with PIN domain [Actinopolyspora lacussalsi]
MLVRPARELLFFVGSRHRGGPVRVPHDGTAALGHLVQSTGVLLTRDRGLLRRRALLEGAYVYASDPARQQTEVLARFEPTPRPWTRCVSCNGQLVVVPKAEIAARLEPGTRRCYDEFARCVACGGIYWPGAHSPRLRAIVESALRRAVRDDHLVEGPGSVQG